MKKLLHFFRLAFSENGRPSAKRVLSGYLVAIVGGCVIYVVLSNPFTEEIKELLNFQSLCACSLAGVAVVTAFAKGGKK